MLGRSEGSYCHGNFVEILSGHLQNLPQLEDRAVVEDRVVFLVQARIQGQLFAASRV